MGVQLLPTQIHSFTGKLFTPDFASQAEDSRGKFNG
jgi:hypothetical protein